MTPFTAANGYYMAGSYLNGKVVDSLGGGICQVSTTLPLFCQIPVYNVNGILYIQCVTRLSLLYAEHAVFQGKPHIGHGKVVDSRGGGICQVSTTLYNAVLLSELEVTERYNHSMIVTYVRLIATISKSSSSL